MYEFYFVQEIQLDGLAMNYNSWKLKIEREMLELE